MSPDKKEWPSVGIGDKFKSWGGLTPSKKSPEYWGPGVPWVSSQEVKGRRLSETTLTVTTNAVSETGLRVCPVGAVLVVVRSGILAHSLPVTITEVPVVINQDIKAFHSTEPLMNEWLALFLERSAQELLTSSRRDGTTVQSIRYDVLKQTRIPLPPLSVRRATLRRIEQLRARFSTADERLASAMSKARSFRNVVVRDACSGALTANWRKARSVNGARWRHVRLEHLLVEPMANGRSVPDGNGFPVLRLNAIRSGQVDLSVQKRGSWTAAEANNFRVREGDFLVVRGNGSLQLVGRGGVVGEVNDSVAYPDTLIRVRANSKQITTPFLALIWDSDQIRSQIETAAHTSAGIHKVSQGDLADIAVPVPPVDEQAAVVERAQELLGVADRVLDGIGMARNRARRAWEDVLDRALTGGLLT